MTRYPIQSVIALGVLITSISGAGVVAVFTDTATTGANSVTSGDQAHLNALQIATATLGPGGIIECDTFSADLQTGLFTMNGAQPGDTQNAYICLRNDYSATLNLSVGVMDLVDTDPYCTNEESTFDTSCGSGAGELSGVLAATFGPYADCATPTNVNTGQLLSVLAADPIGFDSAAQAEVACFQIQVSYGLSASGPQRQAAQTDDVSWRFAFTGTE